MESLNDRIRVLRERHKAIILAHNYTLPEVQDIADFVGDSLELAFRASAARADVIVFCGVHFMAETAKILNPRASVLMPDLRAGCPMTDMVSAADLRHFKQGHPDVKVVSYVNTTAEVKAESDICCTSANAQAIVAALPPSQAILFLPDRNLGNWVEKSLGRRMTMWNGFCPTHQRILPEFADAARGQHPRALVVAHPECLEAVLAKADHIASTSGILSSCRSSSCTQFIIATERGILHRLKKENPGKAFLEASPHMNCPSMRLATSEKILWCLEDLTGEVTVDPAIADRARRSIERMFEAVPRRT